MQMRTEQIVVFLLAAGAVASAWAQPAGIHRANGRNEITYHLVGSALEGAPPDGDRPRQQAVPAAHRHEFALPYAGGYDVQAESNVADVHPQGRMTVEERRILRRQIGEVGHELYAPRR